MSEVSVIISPCYHKIVHLLPRSDVDLEASTPIRGHSSSSILYEEEKKIPVYKALTQIFGWRIVFTTSLHGAFLSS